MGMFLSYYVVTKILVGSESSPGLLMVKDTGPYIYSFFNLGFALLDRFVDDFSIDFCLMTGTDTDTDVDTDTDTGY